MYFEVVALLHDSSVRASLMVVMTPSHFFPFKAVVRANIVLKKAFSQEIPKNILFVLYIFKGFLKGCHCTKQI